jgi:2-polyprenyl-3-methyl-5-hydroxy-6-metoxy-1,4-benzoquinol methylase
MNYKNTPFLNANCPLCNSNNCSLLYEVKAKNSAIHSAVTTNEYDVEKINNLENHIKNRIWNNSTAKQIYCKNCSFTFSYPFVSGDSDYYNLAYHSNHETLQSNLWEWEFECTKDSMLSKINSKTQINLLEIGASIGDFIKGITKDNLIKKKNIVCTEYSSRGIKELEKLGVKALSVDIKTFYKNPIFQNRFDFICLFQVLEHLDQLDKLFETFEYISRPNCHIYVAVPNGNRIVFNEKNKSLLDLPPNHIGRYNSQSIEQLAQRFGWTLSEFKIQEQTSQEILTEMLYNRSLQRKIEDVNFNTYRKILTFLDVNILKIKIALQRKKIGDNIWFCLAKK